MSITWLATQDHRRFPPVDHATEHGLLAAGGDLSAERLLVAYRSGIFPWFNKDDPILWWSPDPRMVLLTDQVKVSKSLKRTLKKQTFHVTFDHAFEDVMQACAQPREPETDPDNATWIHNTMIDAYSTLHQMGHAHSVECWLDNKLVGGLYGVAIGQMFFGESMFSFVSDSSKVALIALCQQLHRWGMPLIDCQVHSNHLASLGAEEMSRKDFITTLDVLCDKSQLHQDWQFDKDIPYVP
jgi:leucyl/phenylalanyl-tRNA--protein transferase